jgi:hypothetical protein
MRNDVKKNLDTERMRRINHIFELGFGAWGNMFNVL